MLFLVTMVKMSDVDRLWENILKSCFTVGASGLAFAILGYLITVYKKFLTVDPRDVRIHIKSVKFKTKCTLWLPVASQLDILKVR